MLSWILPAAPINLVKNSCNHLLKQKIISVLTLTGERDRRDSFGDRDRFLSSRDRDLRRDSFAGVRDRLRSRESPRDSRVESLRSLE